MLYRTEIRRSAFTSDVVRLGLHGVPEEDENVDPAVRDHRAELLVAAEGPRFQPDHGVHEGLACEDLLQLLLHQAARRPRADELVVQEHFPVPAHPFDEVPLAVVVRDKRDVLRDLHTPP